MSSQQPPQLHLTLPNNTTSFKRSFEQFGFDLESPVGEGSSSGSGSSSTSFIAGNDRNKRARSSSASDDTDSLSSGSSSALTSASSSGPIITAALPTATSSSTLAGPGSSMASVPARLTVSIPPSTLEDPPRLPTPVIQDIEMSDYPLLDPQQPPSHASPSSATSSDSVDVRSLLVEGTSTFSIANERYESLNSPGQSYGASGPRNLPLPRQPTSPPVLPPLSLIPTSISGARVQSPASPNSSITFLAPPGHSSSSLPELFHTGHSTSSSTGLASGAVGGSNAIAGPSSGTMPDRELIPPIQQSLPLTLHPYFEDRTPDDEEATDRLDNVDRFIAGRLSPVLVGTELDLSPIDSTASTAGDWPQLDLADVSAPANRDEDDDFRERVSSALNVIRPASPLVRDLDDLRPSSSAVGASARGRISGAGQSAASTSIPSSSSSNPLSLPSTLASPLFWPYEQPFGASGPPIPNDGENRSLSRNFERRRQALYPGHDRSAGPSSRSGSAIATMSSYYAILGDGDDDLSPPSSYSEYLSSLHSSSRPISSATSANPGLNYSRNSPPPSLEQGFPRFTTSSLSDEIHRSIQELDRRHDVFRQTLTLAELQHMNNERQERVDRMQRTLGMRTDGMRDRVSSLRTGSSGSTSSLPSARQDVLPPHWHIVSEGERRSTEDGERRVRIERLLAEYRERDREASRARPSREQASSTSGIGTSTGRPPGYSLLEHVPNREDDPSRWELTWNESQPEWPRTQTTNHDGSSTMTNPDATASRQRLADMRRMLMAHATASRIQSILNDSNRNPSSSMGVSASSSTARQPAEESLIPSGGLFDQPPRLGRDGENSIRDILEIRERWRQTEERNRANATAARDASSTASASGISSRLSPISTSGEGLASRRRHRPEDLDISSSGSSLFPSISTPPALSTDIFRSHGLDLARGRSDPTFTHLSSHSATTLPGSSQQTAASSSRPAAADGRNRPIERLRILRGAPTSSSSAAPASASDSFSSAVPRASVHYYLDSPTVEDSRDDHADRWMMDIDEEMPLESGTMDPLLAPVSQIPPIETSPMGTANVPPSIPPPDLGMSFDPIVAPPTEDHGVRFQLPGDAQPRIYGTGPLYLPPMMEPSFQRHARPSTSQPHPQARTSGPGSGSAPQPTAGPSTARQSSLINPELFEPGIYRDTVARIREASLREQARSSHSSVSTNNMTSSAFSSSRGGMSGSSSGLPPSLSRAPSGSSTAPALPPLGFEDTALYNRLRATASRRPTSMQAGTSSEQRPQLAPGHPERATQGAIDYFERMMQYPSHANPHSRYRSYSPTSSSAAPSRRHSLHTEPGRHVAEANADSTNSPASRPTMHEVLTRHIRHEASRVHLGEPNPASGIAPSSSDTTSNPWTRPPSNASMPGRGASASSRRDLPSLPRPSSPWGPGFAADGFFDSDSDDDREDPWSTFSPRTFNRRTHASSGRPSAGGSGSRLPQRSGSERRPSGSGPSTSRTTTGSGEPTRREMMDRMRNHMRMAHSHARYGRLARELEMASVIGRGRFGRGDFIRDEEFDDSYDALMALAARIGDAQPKSTPQHILEGMESATYKDWASEESDKRCPICLDDYTPDCQLSKLPHCSHWLHKECLEQWLSDASTCPVCRKSVRTPGSSPVPTARRRRLSLNLGTGPNQNRTGTSSISESLRSILEPPHWPSGAIPGTLADYLTHSFPDRDGRGGTSASASASTNLVGVRREIDRSYRYQLEAVELPPFRRTPSSTNNATTGLTPSTGVNTSGTSNNANANSGAPSGNGAMSNNGSDASHRNRGSEYLAWRSLYDRDRPGGF